jgi:hypothetical protein
MQHRLTHICWTCRWYAGGDDFKLGRARGTVQSSCTRARAAVGRAPRMLPPGTVVDDDDDDDDDIFRTDDARSDGVVVVVELELELELELEGVGGRALQTRRLCRPGGGVVACRRCAGAQGLHREVLSCG